MSEWNAYVAGFFDGEGHVSIGRVRVGERSDYHKIVVGIGQRSKSRAVLDRIQADFGGHIYIANQKTRIAEQWAEQANWELQDKPSIRVFLEAIQPYVIVKASQVALGLEFIQTFQKSPHMRDALGRIRGRALTANEVERRERIRLAMREANLLGPPRVKPSTLPPLDVQTLERLPEDLSADFTTVPRGERHYRSRLTEDQVRAMRAEHDAGGVTRSVLAAKYGITVMALDRIIYRQTWRHVT